MKSEDFKAALAMYAEADQRSTAGLIEMLTAAILLKLHPPVGPEDVVSVSVSPLDVSETIRTHHFEAQYVGDQMTIFLTPRNAPAPVDAPA